jgi:Phage protein
MCKISTEAPPCVRLGEPMNHCAKAHYKEEILHHVDLRGNWQGWKIRGKDLISPDGDRISTERLRGILYMEIAAKSKMKLTREKANLNNNSGQIIQFTKLKTVRDRSM